MRLLYLCLFGAVALATQAVAQAPPLASPSDAEIAAAHADCNKSDHFVGIGTVRNRPLDAGQYKPEWKAAGCIEIDAEYEKRDLAKKKADTDAIKRLQDLRNKLTK